MCVIPSIVLRSKFEPSFSREAKNVRLRERDFLARFSIFFFQYPLNRHGGGAEGIVKKHPPPRTAYGVNSTYTSVVPVLPSTAWTLLSDSPTMSTVGDDDNEGLSPIRVCASLQDDAAAYFHKVGATCYALCAWDPLLSEASPSFSRTPQ